MVNWKTLQDNTDGSQDGATRTSNDTAKLHNSVWNLHPSTNNFRDGKVGKMKDILNFTFLEVTVHNIDGVSLKTYDAAIQLKN